MTFHPQKHLFQKSFWFVPIFVPANLYFLKCSQPMESKDVAKTKLLSDAALEDLRIRVQKRYLSNALDRKPMIINTFLGSYEALRGDILRVFPNAEPSISLTRLRKFFYYTNPALCATEQLERGSFGKDFLEVLEHYVAQPEAQPTHRSPKKWWMLVGAFCLLCVMGATWCFNPQEIRDFEEYFEDTSLDGLKKNGWEIADFDSSLWFPQNRSGMLTLRTSRGDYWFTPPDTPVIHNLLFKKLPECPCFKLTFKIRDFRPNENFQQVGVVFLNDRKERNHNIRVTTAVGGVSHKLQVIKREHGQAYELSQPLRNIETDPPIDSIWVVVEKRDNEFEFFYNLRNEYGPFTSFAKMTFDFEPAYIGIGAFNGIRQYDFGPFNTSSSIPAYVDYLKFACCEGLKR